LDECTRGGESYLPSRRKKRGSGFWEGRKRREKTDEKEKDLMKSPSFFPHRGSQHGGKDRNSVFKKGKKKGGEGGAGIDGMTGCWEGRMLRSTFRESSPRGGGK